MVLSLAVGLFGLLLVALEGWGGAKHRHLLQLHRIDHWLAVAGAFPPRGMNQHEWSQALVGPHNALYNVLHHPQLIATKKVRELADHLERTQAAQLSSMGALLGFVEYLEKVSPNAKDYGPFEHLRTSYPAVKPVLFEVPPGDR